MSEVHSRLAASAASRWIRCPGSIAYIEFLRHENKLPEDKPSAASTKGTHCHTVLEFCVKKSRQPVKLSERFLNRLINKYKLSYEDLKGVQLYWEYIEKQKGYFDETFTERRYDLSNRYREDIGGTADITQCKERDILHIGDYKNGRTLVEVVDNYQLRIYGLGAYYEFNDDYKFEELMMTIGQPNAYHPEGSIRDEVITISELRKWEENYLVPAIEKIRNKTSELIPGDKQCEWCPARNVCEANAKQSLQIAHLDFKQYAEPRQDLPVISSLTTQQIVFILDNKHRLINFLNGVETHAQAMLANDERVGSYHLHTKKGNRKLKEEDELKKLCYSHKLKWTEIKTRPDPKLPTLGELEKYLKVKKDWSDSRIAKFMEKATTRAEGKMQLTKSASHVGELDFAEFKEVPDNSVETEVRKPKRKPLRKQRK